MRLDVKKFLKLINPLPAVGGLEISDSVLRFMLLSEHGKPVTASLRIPPGVVDGGRLKNREAFIQALRELHRRVARRHGSIHVVLNLPAHIVYTQSFGIPFLSEERLGEAAHLNLQMLSPMDFGKAYASWQKVGESFAEGGQIELLGAFAERSAVEEFTVSVGEAGFVPVAVEFPSLALARVIAGRSDAAPGESYLSIYMASDGASLGIQRSGNMHFNHFHSWASIQGEFGGKQISADDFRSFLVREIQKVLNFYTGRWGGTVSAAVILSSSMGDQIGKLVEENFGIPVKRVAPKDFPNLDPSWFVAFGAALRGLVPRGNDTFISLSSESVQIQYREARILNFITLWRNIGVTVFAFILVLFTAADFFMAREEARIQSRTPIGEAELAEVKRLEASAKEFNSLVAAALEAKNQGVRWSKLIDTVAAVGAGKVKLVKVSVADATAAAAASVSVTGSAVGAAPVLQFRDGLQRISNLSNVVLPLEGIRANLDGSVDFTLTFHLKSLEL